jgi:hypothetical protein
MVTSTVNYSTNNAQKEAIGHYSIPCLRLFHHLTLLTSSFATIPVHSMKLNSM